MQSSQPDSWTRRVRLRPPRDSDVTSTAAWLPEAFAAMDRTLRAPFAPIRLDALRRDLRQGTEFLVVTAGDDQPIGLVALREHERVVRFELLTIAAAHRNLGLGSEAVAGAEARYAGRAFEAGVPLHNGLAIYFWLRAGYRPLAQAQAIHGVPNGLTWMVRDADAQQFGAPR